MSKAWLPQNWEEACKRNAGRKKLHQRKRKERADRIVRLLAAIDTAPELLESSYGWLSITAETMRRSRAAASREFQLARRIHNQFARMFGRKFEIKKDQILWSWDWSHYGFRARESYEAGFRKAVGKFSFRYSSSSFRGRILRLVNRLRWHSEALSITRARGETTAETQRPTVLTEDLVVKSVSVKRGGMCCYCSQ